jgi:hypothetical protein
MHPNGRVLSPALRFDKLIADEGDPMANCKLRKVQSSFWRSIAGEPGEHAFDAGLVAEIEPSLTLDPAGRLAVYADAYLTRLRDVLAEDFPRAAALLGREAFDRLAKRYIKAHPSTEPSLRHLGGAMVEFIRDQDDLPPWLADLAALEWARVDAFDAPDDGVLTAAELAAIDPASWPQLRLLAVRSLQVIDAAWPVHRLWAGDDCAIEGAPTTIRVWRRSDFHVVHAPMDACEAAAVRRLLDGGTFARICEVFEHLDEQQAAREAGALMLRWLEDGIIARAE